MSIEQLAMQALCLTTALMLVASFIENKFKKNEKDG